jgi:hypothetical protein
VPSFSGVQRIELLNALAPLRSPHVAHFVVALDTYDAAFGQTKLTALQRSLGSGLASLYLGLCTLESSFWSALAQALPQLKELWLGPGVVCELLDVGPQLLDFCSRRPASQPFMLHLHAGLYGACYGAEIQASLNNQGLSHVSIVDGKAIRRERCQLQLGLWSTYLLDQVHRQGMPAAAPNL